MPDVDLRIFGAAHDVRLIRAAKGGAYDEAALLVPRESAHDARLREVPQMDLVAHRVDKSVPTVAREAKGGDCDAREHRHTRG